MTKDRIKMHYISYETGYKYYPKEGANFLNKCPICNISLMWNSYKDLYVSDKHEFHQDNIELKIEKCRKCGDIFILVL